MNAAEPTRRKAAAAAANTRDVVITNNVPTAPPSEKGSRRPRGDDDHDHGNGKGKGKDRSGKDRSGKHDDDDGALLTGVVRRRWFGFGLGRALDWLGVMIPELAHMTWMLALIFGGCCSNVRPPQPPLFLSLVRARIRSVFSLEAHGGVGLEGWRVEDCFGGGWKALGMRLTCWCCL